MPMKTEITPLLIITKLEQYDYAGATAIAVVMLVASFVLLLPSTCCRWSRHYAGADLMVPASCHFHAPRRRAARPRARDHRAAVGALAADRRRAGLPGLVPGRAAGGGVRRGVCQGLGYYFHALTTRRAVAIKLTLLAAGIAVPLNLRLRRGRGVGDRQVRFPRQEPC
jgi:hypothetical protein